jgi:protein-S-isoprenylcysteine O-methyltransferase Ste14
MTVAGMIDLAAFSLLGIVTLGYGAEFRRRGINIVGTPAIPSWAFMIGKGSMFACWGRACLEATGILTSPWIFPDHLRWGGTVLIGLGTIGTLLAYRALGMSLRMGLPSDTTELKTDGIYRLSRNPFYASFLLLSAGSVFHAPGPWTLALGGIGAAIHHWIILGEERFLAERFGRDWEAYAGRVRRYL